MPGPDVAVKARRAGHRGGNAHADGGDFVFALDGDAAHLGQFADHVKQDGCGGGDRIAGEEGYAGIQGAPRDGGGAVDEFTHRFSTLRNE